VSQTLNELERDAVAEVFNIGISRAAASLSEMVNREVMLSLPSLVMTTISEARQTISSQFGEVSGVLESFDGAVAGNALLLFPQNRTDELIRLLFPGDMPDELLKEMENDALTEVGNIILNAALSSLSDIIDEKLENKIPKTFEGQLSESIFTNGLFENTSQPVIQLDMSISVKDSGLIGNISFLVIIKSITNFKEKLSNYFGLPFSA
jgi:chemotaxis protein CheC